MHTVRDIKSYMKYAKRDTRYDIYQVKFLRKFRFPTDVRKSS